MSSLWLGPKSFIRVVGRSRSPVTRGAPAKEENLHEPLTQFPFSNPGAGELRDYLREEEQQRNVHGSAANDTQKVAVEAERGERRASATPARTHPRAR